MPTVSARALAAIPAVAIGIVVAVVAFRSSLAPRRRIARGGLGPLPSVAHACPGHAIGAPVPRGGAARRGDEPRLESLVESVCASHGITEPTLHLCRHRRCRRGRRRQAPTTPTSSSPEVWSTDSTGSNSRRSSPEELSMFGSASQAATVLAAIDAVGRPARPTMRDRLLDERRLRGSRLRGGCGHPIPTCACVRASRRPPRTPSSATPTGPITSGWSGSDASGAQPDARRTDRRAVGTVMTSSEMRRVVAVLLALAPLRPACGGNDDENEVRRVRARRSD